VLKKSLLVVFLVLLIDQALKIWVKTHMFLGEEIQLIGDRGVIHFTENYGMAFGMEFAGNYGKLFLSIFRIIAVGFIGWYIYKLTDKPGIKTGLIVSLSLIFAGAVGNIIDSAFYGMIFNDSFFQIATLFPDGGGYGSFLHGKVVDMLYFPIIQTHYPQWFPFWGGEEFIFFRPVFNISDASITTGVLMLVVFQKRYFKKQADNKDVASQEKEEQPDAVISSNQNKGE
jgi:signal peptidase II